MSTPEFSTTEEMAADKHPHLIGFDHLEAGYWGVMLARSEAEIAEKWPEVSIVQQRPRWMSDERYAKYLADPYVIDGEPRGILNIIVRSRNEPELQ